MNLNQILKNIITDYTELEEIYRRVKEVRMYKIATIERELRRMSNQGDISPVMKKNYIIGYNIPNQSKKPTTSLNTPIKRPVRSNITINNNLDHKIAEIVSKLMKTDPYKAGEILREKSDYNKRQIIKQYE